MQEQEPSKHSMNRETRRGSPISGTESAEAPTHKDRDRNNKGTKAGQNRSKHSFCHYSTIQQAQASQKLASPCVPWLSPFFFFFSFFSNPCKRAEPSQQKEKPLTDSFGLHFPCAVLHAVDPPLDPAVTPAQSPILLSACIVLLISAHASLQGHSRWPRNHRYKASFGKEATNSPKFLQNELM